MSRTSAQSQVRPHAFERDQDVPRDVRGRLWCRWCHLPGYRGDHRHPVDALPWQAPADPDAIDLDARILGEAAREGAL